MKKIFNLIKDIIFSLFLAFIGLMIMVVFEKLMEFDLFAYPVFLIASYFIFRRLRRYKARHSKL